MMENKIDWKEGDVFITPETGDTEFTVIEVTNHDVKAYDSRSRAGITVFAKWWITKVTGLIKCDNCGLYFDPSDLANVFAHDHSNGAILPNGLYNGTRIS